jgi:hypothetical protein
MPADELALLAQSVEREIGGGTRAYSEDDHQLFPIGLYIVIARR